MTPLEELIKQRPSEYSKATDGGRMYHPADTNCKYAHDLQEYISRLVKFIKSESSRTEEIAIGFSKWKWENGWRITYLEKEKGLCYENLSDWPVFKTDRELFKDYMESLKP